MTVTPIGAGVYRVTDDGRHWTVAVAGPPENRWVWVNGQVARLPPPALAATGTRARTSHHDLTAPMPATVVSIAAAAGTRVARGDTLLVLEAMKMELPVRAPHDGVVAAVHCTVGELVQPGNPLIEITADEE